MPNMVNNVDFNRNQALNLVLQQLATAPGSPAEGQVWEDTTTSLCMLRLGGVTIALGRLDQLTAPTGPLALNAQRITGLATPIAVTDAATKGYVDATTLGLEFKTSVRAASTGLLTLSGTQTVDGVSLVAGDRILALSQPAPATNGIYVVAAGTWARSPDANTSALMPSGTFVFVEEGTVNDNSGWVLATNNPITLGTTSLTFVQFSKAGAYTAGNGLSLIGSQFSVVGTANRIVVSGSGVDIDSAYIGQSSITTVGTIGTGTWQGTPVAVANGGTSATTPAGARTNLGANGKYTTSIGDGTATSYTVTHSLGTKNVIWQLFDNTGTFDDAIPNVSRPTINTLTVSFSVAPAVNRWQIVVEG